MDDFPSLPIETVTGIVVAISGNVLISLALNLQKLAHKRLDAQKCFHANGNGPLRSLLTPRRGSPYASSPNERDEDSDTVIEPLTPPLWHTPILESQPLLFHRSGNNIILNQEDDLPEHESCNPELFRRMLSFKKLPNKIKQGAILPVDGNVVRGSESSQGWADDEDRQTNETAYLKSKLWWTGFALMNVGELGNFISYAFAPASVVAPLGTFALIANCVFAPLMLSEHFRKRDFFGICIAIVGAVTVVISSNASDARLDSRQLLEAIKQTPFLIYVGTYIVGAVILAGLSHGRMGRVYVFIDVGLCALFGGFTVLSTKALSTLISLNWYGIFAKWITYPLIFILLGTGIGQIRYLNRALMRFDSKTVIPIQFVFFTLSAITGSAILYGDFRKAGFHAIVTFLYGCAATFIGVFIIANDTTSDREEHVPRIIRPEEELQDGSRLGMGTIGKKCHTTLETPILRKQKSGVGVVGIISPAPQLLLAHTPTRESPVVSREGETGYEDGDIASTSSSFGRNRSLPLFMNNSAWSGASSPRRREL